MIAAAAGVPPTPGLVTGVRVVELVALTAVAVVLFRRWWPRRAAPTGWALAVFGVLTVVIATGFLPAVPRDTLPSLIYLKVLISVLLAVPYLLVLFTRSLQAIGDRAFGLATALFAAEMLATLLSPRLSAPGASSRPSWEAAYVVLVVAAWCLQSALVAVCLWRAGRAQPAAIRMRMRSLSLGAVVVALALVVSSSSSERGTALEVVTALLGLTGILLLALAFLMPAPLRVLWRRGDLAQMAHAERGLMTALSRQDVATTILPTLAATLGGDGAALLDRDGSTVSRFGMAAEELELLLPRLGGPDETADETTLVFPMTTGWLVVRAGRLAPVFGPDEQLLLERVANLVDLALQCVQLFEEEQHSRREAEALNNELQTLLYSVSHDLRSPIISVLGYLDCLEQDHRAELSATGQHYLDRITVNASYMQRLIQDLLELSRIGRVDDAVEPVDLRVVAESVAEGTRFAHPSVSVDVADDLPVVAMSDVRARQLVTNLVDNAVKHAGRPDVQVRLSATPEPGGGVTVCVADNGRGVAESYRAKAFDVFERLDAARIGTPGTGMGLPICKRVVEGIGGTIVVDGPQPGFATGTTLRISFPASAVRRNVHPLKENA